MNLTPSTTSWVLYLTLGSIGSLAYALRFLIQWIKSERKGESHVTEIFWQISLFGYLVMVAHFFIQYQFNFCLAQACNAVISWRNLNLMNPDTRKRCRLRTVIIAFICVIALVISLFLFRDIFFHSSANWFRSPLKSKTSQNLNPIWHVIGTIGIALFVSRFWIQWWSAEKHKKSVLTTPFWYLSIFGAVITLIYSINNRDLIAMANYSFGIIPYTRNLILISRKKRTQKKAQA